MPFTKINSKAVEDGSIITTDLADDAVTNEKLADGTIENSKLSNSSITLLGETVSLGGSITVQLNDVEWQTVTVADGSTFNTAEAGKGYLIDTSSAAHTINLPSSPSFGDTIGIKDYASNFGTNNLTINRNGNKIQGLDFNSLVSTDRASLILVYVDATQGWLYTLTSNVGDLQQSKFTEATGGTVTTTGDFKVHTFTSDGCFSVSQTGAGPAGGPSDVDYLVVAGGGGGHTIEGGGGGAGGYRTTFPSPGCNAGSHPISVQTYPITVGGGGLGFTPGSPNIQATSGSNSTFDTITSAGGGAGGGTPTALYPRPAARDGVAGGSGGGASGSGGSSCQGAGGAGNTPPVSPSQGNNGGNGDQGPSPQRYGGGGGGANAVGQSGPSGGDGGAGSPNSITGTATSYAGGGGGGSEGPGARSSDGGAGGGGPSPAGNNGVSGTANTGGGGGSHNRGTSGTTGSGGSGGSGIVIIRYKYQ